MNPFKPTLFIILFGIMSSSNAQVLDSLKKKMHFEMSFGHSLLFISNSKQIDIKNEEAIVVPTSAVLFFTEFRPEKFMRIPVFLNIATETKQFLVDSVLVNEKASPTFGTGLVFKVFQIKIDDKSKVEFEAGPLASFLFETDNSIRIAPIIAGRFRISRGENFVMYIGTSYSIGIDALGLVYGTGTVF